MVGCVCVLEGFDVYKKVRGVESDGRGKFSVFFFSFAYLFIYRFHESCFTLSMLHSMKPNK